MAATDVLPDDQEIPPMPPLEFDDSNSAAPMELEGEVVPNEADDSVEVPAAQRLKPADDPKTNIADFQISESPSDDLSDWNGSSESDHSVLEPGTMDESQNELDRLVEALDNGGMPDKRLKVLPVSRAKAIAEPADTGDVLPPPTDAIEHLDGVELDPIPLPAVKDVPLPPIVLKARPVERHRLNDDRTTSQDHFSLADARHLVPTELRPRAQSSTPVEIPIEAENAESDSSEAAPEGASQEVLEGGEPVVQDQESAAAPAAAATSFDEPVTTPVIRARTVSDRTPPNQAWFADSEHRRSAILRLHAISPQDGSAKLRSTAKIDMRAPIIVRSHHPDFVPSGGNESDNVQQAVRTILKAKTKLKTIER